MSKPHIKTKIPIENKRYCHSSNAVKSCVPIYIPTMLPKLLHVAHRPAKKPLVFFGNQFPKIEMKQGQSIALRAPIKAIIPMK
jgi:hypothetical protein